METITIGFWMGKNPKLEEQCGLEHNQTFTYNNQTRNWLAEKILDAGFNLMMQRCDKELRIWIDTRCFQTR